MTKHPNDEFDRVPEFTDRKGIHRQTIAGAATRRSPLGWIVAFGILALVVGLFSYFVLPQLTDQPVATSADGSSSASQSPPPASEAAAESKAPEESKDDSAAADSSAAAESAAAAKSEAAESAAAAKSEAAKKSKAAAASASSAAAASSSSAAASSSSAAAAPDTSIKVGVYNGSRRTGLAATGQAKLSAAGFSNLSAGNWTKRVNSSIVYYKSDEDQATARKAAAAMGISTVYKTTQITGRIAVVLGADY